MITEEHLEHWVSEIRYHLQGAVNELARTVGVSNGVVLDNKAFVSFEYLLEKVNTAYSILHSIEDDMKRDV